MKPNHRLDRTAHPQRVRRPVSSNVSPGYTKHLNLPFNPDEISSFDLIVKTFGSLYAEFKYHLAPGEAICSIPSKDVAPGDVRKQYRGIDREPLSAVKRSRYLFYKYS